jgi:5,10-methylenetetrahydromethanopterin reductase
MALDINCALNSSTDSPEHARIAEQLGYTRAWFYDSPALYSDVWVQLCRAAERTERIALGPGVTIPSLRHPMVTATSIATLVGMAGASRVMVGVGTGFTGRMTFGQRSLKWADVATYVRVVKSLLRGDEVEWDGAPIKMMQWPGFGAPRPIEVPFVIAVGGPKGVGVADELGDGVFTAPGLVLRHKWSMVLMWGTVLDPGEDPATERVIAAAGHGAAVAMHAATEFGFVERLPNGAEWSAAYDDVPVASRHLALHDGHLCGVSDRDRPFVTGERLAASGLAIDASMWRDKLAKLEAQGATAIAYQPAGPDIARELEMFMDVARETMAVHVST